MDAGLAKVINSTVGTGKFMSLDEILYLSKSIAADETSVYQVFPENFQNLRGGAREEKAICKMYLPLDGSVYLLYKAGTVSYEKGDSIYFRIYKNGTLYRNIDEGPQEIDNTNKVKKTVLLEGKRGDVFEIRLYSDKYATPVANLYAILAVIHNSKTMNAELM
jgi:hypothetical protein